MAEDDNVGKIKPMYVRLSPELHQRVKQRAIEEERTMAQLIRFALRYYLDATEDV